MDKKTLEIDDALYSRAEGALDRLGFPSVEALVSHLLRDHLGRADSGEVFTEEEEEEVKDRLRALGYLD